MQTSHLEDIQSNSTKPDLGIFKHQREREKERKSLQSPLSLELNIDKMVNIYNECSEYCEAGVTIQRKESINCRYPTFYCDFNLQQDIGEWIKGIKTRYAQAGLTLD